MNSNDIKEMKKLNVLCLVLATSIGLACSQSKKEPIVLESPKGKEIVKPSKPEDGKKDEEKKKEEEKKDSKESNRRKEGFYMLKSIEEYKGSKLVDKLTFAYDSESCLENISFTDGITLKFSYKLVNDQLSTIEVHSSKEDEVSSMILQLKGDKASALKGDKLSYANFIYDNKHLKSYIRKNGVDNAETYEYLWNEDGNLAIRQGSFNTAYFYQEVKNKVYPDLNFILNAGNTEAYLTNYMCKRSKHFLSSKISKVGGVRREERYAYKFNEQTRPIEVRITTLQNEQDLGTQIFKLSYF